MSAAVNNGVNIGPVTVLVREATRERSVFEAVRDLALSLTFISDVETKDWLVSVHAVGSGEVLASRRFDRKHRAERARADLVAVAEAHEDLETYDWVSALART